jgi:hypothetical protein
MHEYQPNRPSKQEDQKSGGGRGNNPPPEVVVQPAQILLRLSAGLTLSVTKSNSIPRMLNPASL